jgi:AraC-like DNA-binding protein
MYAWIPAILPGAGSAVSGTVSVALVNRIIRGAVDLGASRPVLISALGFNEARLRNPSNRMSWQLVERLFTELEKQFKDPAAALRLGNVTRSQSFSDIGYSARFAANLSDVIEASCEVQSARQNVVAANFDKNHLAPCLIWESIDPAYNVDRFIEFSAAVYASIAAEIIGRPMIINQIHFSHAPRFDEQDYQSVFCCPVEFNMPKSAMWMDSSLLALPSPHADTKMFSAVIEHYKKGSQLIESGKTYAGNGYFYLTSEMDKTPPTLGMMAASFGLSERTLRRRLVDEGYPFRELLIQVRCSLWKLYHKQNILPLSEVAHLLGFGELSAFSRAHRQWYGIPPSEFRL